ncbi:hypothetical protein [Streptomyces sp. WM6372]|uniref:hypothetical protein n=1 Tax=Streptomyces sp. WM6372 TaxID=1415555 RepID=UPI000A86F7D5|nr:hypothetical protein [Streptomyces sp. WM6372]
MSPGELFRTLRRRWYVLVLVAALAAAGAVQVLRPTQTYVSSAIVVLKPPVTGSQPNQLANLQPPLAAVSYAAVQRLESPAGAAELRAAGVDGTYRLMPRNSGTSVTPRYLIPSLQVQAEHTDPAAANLAVLKVVEAYTKRITAMQAEQQIPEKARMSVTLLVPPTAVAQTGTKSRALAGTALLAGVCGVAAALWSDRLVTRRNRRRRESADTGPGDEGETGSRVLVTAAAR